MLFPGEIRPLPVAGSMICGESGPGFVLRLCVDNGIRLTHILEQFGAGSRYYLRHSWYRELAFLFGADPMQMGLALQCAYKQQGRIAVEFMGKRFSRPYQLRQHTPQICPKCLFQYGYAHAAWDLSLVTACPEHACRLIDTCPECDRRVSWRRPSLVQCMCGFCLAGNDVPAEVATSYELWLSAHICNLLCEEGIGIAVPSDTCHVLQRLSLDCLLQVLWTVGILPDEKSSTQPGRLSRGVKTKEAVVIVLRALERLEQVLFLPKRCDGHSEIRTVGLQAILDDCDREQDWAIVMRILDLAATMQGRSVRIQYRPLQTEFNFSATENVCEECRL